MPKLLIRADGGAEIGMGHLVRCRTIALAMRKLGWDVLLLTRGDPNYIWVDILGTPMPFEKSEGEAALGFETASAAKKFGADMVLIDHYGFTTDDFVALWSSGPKIVVIDDFNFYDFENNDSPTYNLPVLPVDVVINPNPGANAEVYKRRGVPLCLFGESYTPIRPEIAEYAGAPLPSEFNVLVTLGGGDVEELALKVAETVANTLLNVPITCCVSPLCKVEKLAKWENAKPNRKLFNEISALPKLMRSSFLAITGGGTTLWEVYCIGRPSISVVWVDNQSSTFKIVEKYRTGIAIDARGGLSVESLSTAIKSIENDSAFRNNMVENQRGLIDGKGAERIAEALDSLKFKIVKS